MINKHLLPNSLKTVQKNFSRKVKLALHKKMKFPIKNISSICDQICSFLWVWSHPLKKFLIENYILGPIFMYFCNLFKILLKVSF